MFGFNILVVMPRPSIRAEYRYIAPHYATLLDDIPARPLPQQQRRNRCR
jgi:hypothetical protein